MFAFVICCFLQPSNPYMPKLLFHLNVHLINEPCHEKTGLQGFRPGPTQTGSAIIEDV